MIEVIENACGGGYGNMDLASMDMTRAGKNADCYSMLEQNEEWIEEWFEGDPDAKPKSSFYNEFCVIKKKLCCQNRETFGRNCDPCPKFKGIVDTTRVMNVLTCIIHFRCNLQWSWKM